MSGYSIQPDRPTRNDKNHFGTDGAFLLYLLTRYTYLPAHLTRSTSRPPPFISLPTSTNKLQATLEGKAKRGALMKNVHLLPFNLILISISVTCLYTVRPDKWQSLVGSQKYLPIPYCDGDYNQANKRKQI